MRPRFLGIEPIFGRAVYTIDIRAFSEIGQQWTFPAGKFVCLTAADATSAANSEIARFCEFLLGAGCAYFCAWGPDCERVHDVMDETVVGADPTRTVEGTVMTTWHDRESLDSTIWYFLNATVPDEDFAPEGCKAALLITVGNDGQAAAAERSLCAQVQPA